MTASHQLIDETIIDDVKNLDLAKPMYNLLEYSLNYSDTSGSFWFYSKDESTTFDTSIAEDSNFKYSEYKSKWKHCCRWK